MYTVSLEGAGDMQKVGAKALNLQRMIKAGLPVPRGFVLSSDAYARFISLEKLWDRVKVVLDTIEHENLQNLRQKSQEIQALILNMKIPDGMKKELKDAYDALAVSAEVKDAGGKALDFIKAGRGESFVAVRSSVVADEVVNSFAGQTLSLINIIGSDRLFSSIKQCWASLFSPGAIYYRKARGIEGIPLMAVVIQKMVDSEKSGVVFTADPTMNDINRMVIEGSWGLGESIISGIVNPDAYILEKETGELLDSRIGRKAFQYTRDALTGRTIREEVTPSKVDANLLNEQEIKKLWELSKKVEETIGRPQDIEWSIERGRLFLLQARPITTLNGGMPQQQETQGQAILKGTTAFPGVVRGKVRIIADSNELERVEQGDVLVIKKPSSNYTTLLNRISGLVMDTGGISSFMATISREFGTPCIVGTDNATATLMDGQDVILDAARGQILEQAAPAPEIPQDATATALEPALPENLESMPALGESITATGVKLNLAVPDAEEGLQNQCDGVGILRSERMLTAEGRNPFQLAAENPEELTSLIAERVGPLARLFYPKPLCYRSLDLSSEEAGNLSGDETPKEANPLLGWRGIRRALDKPEVLRCEIDALKRLNEQGLNNVVLLLPFISTVQEFRAARDMAAGLKLGIVIDTPSSALGIEDFCQEGIAHAVINLGNLTQLTLGVDRENPEISRLYSEGDPSVLRLIRLVVNKCRKHGVEASVFGDASMSPELIEKLIEIGIKSISIEKDNLNEMKTAIARIERKVLLEKLRNR